ncbi:uncharacterized protein LOC62_06G008132 [Vanrija pseudolonga]|uniref:Uncharacterized protein n=1 Tax=Vanrija pseudolonga TaxID=143232 RepID=A0AAF1BTC9_9TREE|nr:hypothetical protein LOC62_06G008132 [Vanrija pseudolonga]
MGKPTLAEIDRRNMALLASLHNQAHPPQRYNYLDLRLRSILGAIDPANPYLQSAWEQFVAAVVEARDQAAEEAAEASSSNAAAAAEGTRTVRRRRRGGVSSSRTAAAPYADRRPRASDLAETGPRSADILFRHPRSRLPFTPRVVETLSRSRSPSLPEETASPFSPRPGHVFRPAPDSYAEMFTGGRDEAAAESSSEPVRPRAGNVPYDLRQIFTAAGTPASTTRPTTVAPADLLGRDSSREYRSAPPDEEGHADLHSMFADLTGVTGPGTYAEAVRRSLSTAHPLHGPLPPLPVAAESSWEVLDFQSRSPPLYLDPMVSRRPAEVGGPISLNEGSRAWAAEYERSSARASAAHAGTRRRRSDDYETRTSQMPPPTLRRTRRRIGEGDDRRRDSIRDSTRDTRRDGIVFPTAFEDYLSLVTADDESRPIEDMNPNGAAVAQMAALAQLQGADEATATEAATAPAPTTTDPTAATAGAATSVAALPNATQAPHTTHSGSSDRPIATLPRRLRQLAD